MAANCCFWPPLTYLNYRCVPPAYRMLALNITGLAWNVYLAHAARAGPAPASGNGGG